jgi:hypothetical protein
MEVCPNHITTSKHNIVYLEKMSDSIYKSNHGYFLKKDTSIWVFAPFDKEFDTDTLFNITDTLRNLNE